jgi:hypothetical protein
MCVKRRDVAAGLKGLAYGDVAASLKGLAYRDVAAGLKGLAYGNVAAGLKGLAYGDVAAGLKELAYGDVAASLKELAYGDVAAGLKGLAYGDVIIDGSSSDTFNICTTLRKVVGANYAEQNSSLEADNNSTSQEILRPLKEPEGALPYSPLNRVPSQTNPLHTLAIYFLKTRLIIILLCTPWFPKLFLRFDILTKILYAFLTVPRTSHAPTVCLNLTQTAGRVGCRMFLAHPAASVKALQYPVATLPCLQQSVGRIPVLSRDVQRVTMLRATVAQRPLRYKSRFVATRLYSGVPINRHLY